MRAAALILLPIAVAALALALAGLILPACAVGVWPFTDACPPVRETSSRIDDLAARRDALEAEIAAIQRRLAALPDCPQVASPPAIPPTPRPERRPPPPPPPPRDIDEDKWNNRDISLLEGCWDLEGNFETVEAGNVRTPVRSWTMCFDARGNGSQDFIAFREGKPCSGPVRGAFEGSGQMSIAFTQDARCRPGGVIIRRSATCTLRPDGRAQCTSVRATDRLRQTFVLRRRR